jgi:DNA-binding PadR family transcriptional regulator
MHALGYALLGLLAREPLSGYELTSQIKDRIGPFWSTSHSQVYPELARLEAEGLVLHRVVVQRDRPAKKVYSITAPGLETLKRWVTAPVRPRSARDELVLRAYSVWVAEPAAAAAFFREQERRHRERLAGYEQKLDGMEREWGADVCRVDSPRFASYAAVRRGVGHEREQAAWCAWLAESLEGGRRGEDADDDAR